ANAAGDHLDCHVGCGFAIGDKTKLYGLSNDQVIGVRDRKELESLARGLQRCVSRLTRRYEHLDAIVAFGNSQILGIRWDFLRKRLSRAAPALSLSTNLVGGRERVVDRRNPIGPLLLQMNIEG